MLHLDYVRIEKAIRYLDENFHRQPSLAEVAQAVGLSEYHFQRLFRRWAGISPKRFLQFLTAEHAKQLLRDSRSTLDVAFSVGLSGPGRLHDLLVSTEAMTPGEVKQAGAGLLVRYGIHPGPFGESLLALTDRGICALAFLPGGEKESAVEELRRRWPAAELREDATATLPVLQRVFDGSRELPAPLGLHLRGTNFQIRVWEALLRIPSGAVATYEDVARMIGSPGAARAVGSAVAANPVAYLIPCHRVIRGTGAFGEYRWGSARKRAILGWEAARAHAAAPAVAAG